jgi:restriction system protein
VSRVWVVRHGKTGEREEAALERGLLMPGFEGVGDLTGCSNRAAIDGLVAATYPERTSKVWRGLRSGQLHAFRHAMSEGDLVVLPRKLVAQVAIGRVTGPYQYEPDGPSAHTRQVAWLRTDVPRQAIQPDLLATINGLLTIFEAERNNAVHRIEALAKTGTDPGWLPGTGAAATAKVDGVDAIGAVPQDLDGLARDQISARLATRFVGHDFTRLVAATLEAEGYTTRVSPPGPDDGIDIVAGKGALGFDPPRLVVQCKSGNQVCDLPTFNALIVSVSGLGADHGLLVSWGGFKGSVEKQVNSKFFKIRLWDSEAVLDAIFRTYDRLPEEIRKELPLKRTWTLVADEEDAA